MKKQQAIIRNYHQNMEQFRHQIGNGDFSYEITFHSETQIHNLYLIGFEV